ncbi:MAG: bacteriocin-protection protein, YdeI/OmpD-associated family [bacterium]
MQEVFVENKKQLWAWLKENHSQTESVWLVHYKFASGKTDLTRDLLVDYLLCFGWIDSLPNKVDEYRTKIRISPRKPKSVWSHINKEKVKKLIKTGMMQKSGLKVIEISKEKGTWNKAYLPQSKMTVPSDFLKLLKKRENKNAYEFFKTFDKANLYAVGYRLAVIVDSKKRELKMKAFVEQFKNKKYFYSNKKV